MTAHIISSIGPKSFGLGPVALNLVKGQRLQACDSVVWCLDKPVLAQAMEEANGLAARVIVPFPCVGPRRLAWSPNMESAACGTDGATCEILHQHGLWLALSRATVKWKERYGRPTVIAPHGSLRKWCLDRSMWRKRLALIAYESKNLSCATCFHAVAEPEVSDIRDFGLRGPIAVIPNGVESNSMSRNGDARAFRERFGLRSDKRILLFLGRISPVKNLPMLLEALDTIGFAAMDWVLVIAGSDEFGHQQTVEANVIRRGLSEHIKFVGPLYDSDKQNAYEAAEAFVLPSLTEAAPIVILEALAAGRPVVCTKGAPWRDLVKYNCGWWADISTTSLAAALAECLQLPSETLVAMGNKGRQLVASRYTWASSVSKTLRLYEWLLERGDRPDFIVSD